MELPSITMPFPEFSLAFFINTPVLLTILVLFFVVYAIITGILVYHWSFYGMGASGILVAETLFFFVSLVMFVMAGLTLYYF